MGDRLYHLREACRLITARGIEVLQYSSVYETAPWGKTDQQWFFNAAIEIATDLSPEQLLSTCQSIEREMGRLRVEKWGERIIDIDILYYHQEALSSASLEIPHPGIPSRRFTLMPLVEIAAHGLHPVLGKTQQVLLDHVDDPLDVFRTHHTLAL